MTDTLADWAGRTVSSAVIAEHLNIPLEYVIHYRRERKLARRRAQGRLRSEHEAAQDIGALPAHAAEFRHEPDLLGDALKKWPGRPEPAPAEELRAEHIADLLALAAAREARA